MPSSTFHEGYKTLLQTLISTRLGAGVTQVVLAKRLGKPQSYVSKYEHGERRLDIVEFCDIADALGISATDLLSSYLDRRSKG